MQSNKISAHPPIKKPIEDFILGAEQRKKSYTEINKQEKLEIYPWEDNTVRDDVQKVFTVKLPEEYVIKIKYISDRTNKSQQKIVREIICKEIDKLIYEVK